MDLGIAGKVALVTGGSRGLGRQAALSLAREGANVGICARTEEALETTVHELKAAGVDAVGVTGDVMVADDCKRIYRQVTDALGPPDILVNNAGGSRPGTVVTATDEQWSEVIDLNVMSAVRMSRFALPPMQERGWGRVVNIASIWGREAGGSAPYMTSKAALVALTKNMALSLAKDGVLVNCVAPGSIAFPGGSWDRFQQNQTEEAVAEFIDRNLPMGKFGWPEPVGDLIAYLSSDRAGLLTGTCINIDGGQSKSLI